MKVIEQLTRSVAVNIKSYLALNNFFIFNAAHYGIYLAFFYVQQQKHQVNCDSQMMPDY